MKFSDTLWNGIEDLWQKIRRHPFNEELAAGTLNEDAFRFYLEQDSLYLVDFSRALALLSARFSEPAISRQLLDFSAGALVAERELHQSFLSQYSDARPSRQEPACLLYTQFLLATCALEPVEVAWAALLPCFWIYQRVGKEISEARVLGGPNPYQRWINTYASPEFAMTVTNAVQLCDELSTRNPLQQPRMAEFFRTSTVLEWMFWEGAYRRSVFPLQFRSLASIDGNP